MGHSTYSYPAKSTVLTATGDVKAFGEPAEIDSLTINHNGTGTGFGWIELRDATSPPGNSGTLRWRQRFIASNNSTVHVIFDKTLYMSQGIRLVIGPVNTEVTVLWRG